MDNWNTKQKIIAQGICILLSIGLWFYVTNSENPLMISDLNKVPVEIVNAEALKASKLILAPNQEFYVSLKIEGLSQDLRKVNKSDFKIKVDLSEYALKAGERKIPVNIVDWPDKINIKNANGLTVSIVIEDYVEKEVTVNSNIEIIAQPNHYVAPPIFNPASIKVFGPSSLVETVESVIAYGQEANVNETIVKNYTIYPVDGNGKEIKGVELSQDTVEGTINVNKGKFVPIKVTTAGVLEQGLKLKNITLNDSNVEINGPKDLLDKITEISTNPIDLSTITDDTHLDVSLVIPDGIQIDSQKHKVAVTIDVDKTISKEISVPFTIINVPEMLKVVASSETINVKVTGLQEELDKITLENIKAELDVSKHTEAGKFSEAPKVTLINAGSTIIIESTDKIEFEIVKEEITPTE